MEITVVCGSIVAAMGGILSTLPVIFFFVVVGFTGILFSASPLGSTGEGGGGRAAGRDPDEEAAWGALDAIATLETWLLDDALNFVPILCFLVKMIHPHPKQRQMSKRIHAKMTITTMKLESEEELAVESF